MSRSAIRLLLPFALSVLLVACGGEEEVAETPESSANTVADSAPKAPPPPQLAAVKTPYERALRALTSGGSVRFEAEITLPDGSQQFATGASESQDYAFGLRTLPKPGEADGNWLLHGGRYFRESPSGYDVAGQAATAVALLVEALTALPQDEATLVVDASPAAGECRTRSVDLAQRPHLLTRFRKLDACVDEANAHLLRIDAELQTGEKLLARLSAHGQPVQIPKVSVPDWSQEFPRR
ncbi:MAG: hypothetical protein IT479_05285 [Xanthomonadales bacterium]|nr:hypothetical protein [Xanthomonadales bacterium]MCE7930796.1 hypothetical protein [Xanthomonadales bacterium PRO6]